MLGLKDVAYIALLVVSLAFGAWFSHAHNTTIRAARDQEWTAELERQKARATKEKTEHAAKVAAEVEKVAKAYDDAYKKLETYTNTLESIYKETEHAASVANDRAEKLASECTLPTKVLDVVKKKVRAINEPLK